VVLRDVLLMFRSKQNTKGR